MNDATGTPSICVYLGIGSTTAIALAIAGHAFGTRLQKTHILCTQCRQRAPLELLGIWLNILRKRLAKRIAGKS